MAVYNAAGFKLINIKNDEQATNYYNADHSLENLIYDNLTSSFNKILTVVNATSEVVALTFKKYLDACHDSKFLETLVEDIVFVFNKLIDSDVFLYTRHNISDLKFLINSMEDLEAQHSKLVGDKNDIWTVAKTLETMKIRFEGQKSRVRQSNLTGDFSIFDRQSQHNGNFAKPMPPGMNPKMAQNLGQSNPNLNQNPSKSKTQDENLEADILTK